MKQPEDTKTLDLLPHEHKRGRGRPPLDSAKSDAERARLYRERKKASKQVKRDALPVTINTQSGPSIGLLESRIVLLNAHLIQASDELQAARDKIAELEAKLKFVTRHRK